MINIKFRDIFNITGRGLVYSCSLEDNPELDHNKITDLKDNSEPVIIDGKKYMIKGVERFALPTSLMYLSDSFGLLVKEVNE